MKPLVRLLLLPLIALLPGCYAANQLELEGLKPAEVVIPASVRNLTVVARSDLDSIYKTSLVLAGQRRAFNLDSTVAKQAVLGCSDALVESPRFALFNPVVRRNLDGDYSNPEKKLPWSMIRTIAGDSICDAVLSLEIGSVDDTVGRRITDGWLTYQYSIELKTFWRLYFLNDFQSRDYRFTDTVFYDIESPQEVMSSPDMRIEYLRDAMYQTGMKTARRLAPWWTEFRRYYFAMGPKGFSTGAGYLRQSKWKEAAEIWRPLTESKNKKVAAKACFNMSLTCEMANNFPAAFEWLRKSEKLGIPDYYVTDYQAKLAKRHLETDKLDEQLK
jgi:hypothetical protein